MPQNSKTTYILYSQGFTQALPCMAFAQKFNKIEFTTTTHSNYEHFGMAMEGRTFESMDYKFGFNGQMKDDEIYGPGNTYSALYWEYDARLGRRWNIDPVIKSWQSSYSCFSGNPINRVDPNGDDDYFDETGNYVTSDNHVDENGKTTTEIKVITSDTYNSFTENGLNPIDNMEVFQSASSSFSKSGILTDASLKIYNYYNDTGLPLVNIETKDAIMEFTYDYDKLKITSSSGVKIEARNKSDKNYRIGVNVNGNNKNGLMNNYMNVKNTFKHENKHKLDLLRDGAKIDFSKSKKEKEQSAIDYQRTDETWQSTTDSYKMNVENYEKKVSK